MSARRLLIELAAHGLRIDVGDTQPRIRDAKGILTPSLAAQLRERREAILGALREPAPPYDPWLDSAGAAADAGRPACNLVEMMAEYRRRHDASLAFDFHRVTSCDLWERNPTDAELAAFYMFLWKTPPPPAERGPCRGSGATSTERGGRR